MRFAVYLRRLALPVLMAAMLTGCGKTETNALTPVTPVVDSKPPAGAEQATFAAGCFWSMEAIFKQLKGVVKVEPGYAGGHVANPSYEDVETGTTGHAESINVAFDPKVISYRDLLRVLLTVRNPTTPNRQGNDDGPQYRFIIFYRNAAQKADAKEAIQQIKDSHIWSDPLVVDVDSYTNFYRAEAYHFDYYHRHPNEPYCAGVIAPEIAEFQRKFRSMLK